MPSASGRPHIHQGAALHRRVGTVGDMSLLPETVAASITPDDWYGIITADEDGPWPVCCGNVSAVREVLTELLTVGGAHEVARAGQALAGEAGDHFDPADGSPIAALYAALCAHLDEVRPSWRTDDLDRDHDGFDDFWLKLSLTGTSEAPDAQPAPTAEWGELFLEVSALIDVPPISAGDERRVEWFGEMKVRLEALRCAGAPTEVVAALYRRAVEQLRSS